MLGASEAPQSILDVRIVQDPSYVRRLAHECLPETAIRGDGGSDFITEYSTAVLCNGLRDYETAYEAAKRACEHNDLGLHGWALSELVEAATRTLQLHEGADALARLSKMTRASGTDWAIGIEARARALRVEEGMPRPSSGSPSIESRGPEVDCTWRGVICCTASGYGGRTAAWTLGRSCVAHTRCSQRQGVRHSSGELQASCVRPARRFGSAQSTAFTGSRHKNGRSRSWPEAD
jgi:hypothetical protein